MTRSRITSKKPQESLKAVTPLSMLHMDITLFKTSDGVKQYLYVICDNSSRALLAYEASSEYSSHMATQTLNDVVSKYGLLQSGRQLITNGGSENCRAVTELLAKPGILWKKLVAQVDIVQSNSMVEVMNKTIKHRYLYRNVIATTEELHKLLPIIIADYNKTP